MNAVNDSIKLSNLRKAICGSIILALPFILLYWLVPGWLGLTIGNDYTVYPIDAQLELAHSLEYGIFPLFAPGFAGGQSAAAMTLGQLFHPIIYLASNIPGYWDGAALSINTVLRLLSLGLCHLLLLSLFRALKLSWFAAIILSLIAVYNLRMLDHFRYGASLENHTAFLALCCCVMYYFLDVNKILVALGTILCSYLLVTGGHPQISYIGFLAAGLVALFAPFVISKLTEIPLPNRTLLIKSWSQLILFVVAGGLLASPFILSFVLEFIPSNDVRVGRVYEWSTAYQDSIGGGLRNFYAPLTADVSGAFGGTSLLLLVVTLPVLLLFRVSIPAIVWVMYGLCIVVFCLCLGDVTPVHFWVWKWFPMADNFRTPGRYSLMLLFPMLFILAWLFKQGLSRKVQLSATTSVSVLTILATLALGVYLLFNIVLDSMLPSSAAFTPQNIQHFPNKVIDYWFYLGGATLLLVCVVGMMPETASRTKLSLSALLCLLVAGEFTLSARYGTWIENTTPEKTLAELNQEKRNDFRLHAIPGYGMSTAALDQQLQNSIIDAKLARFYTDTTSRDSLESVWDFLSSSRQQHQAVVLAAPELEQMTLRAGESKIILQKANYNQFDFIVVAQQQGLLSTNIPVRSNWKTFVDDVAVQSFQANGNELAVWVPEGEHTVTLRYHSPAIEYGLVISLCTLFLVLCIAMYRSSFSYKWFAYMMVFSLTVLSAWFWRASLYHGSMPAEYEWSTKEFRSDNVAYGKKTASSSLSNSQMPYLYYSGKAVDGMRQGDWFSTQAQQSPSWKIDLSEIYNIDSLKIFGIDKQSLPIVIWAANTEPGKYSQIASVNRYSDVLELSFDQLQGRYVVVQSKAKKARLAFKEFELYGTPSSQ